MLQDGNYNVVALLGQSGQVLEQYVWDPYGTPVVKHTSATPAPVNRVGHQGLFWHSLDGSATLNTPDPAANPTATGLYYNRNRWYAPHLGRFLQRDPNETGQLIASHISFGGTSPSLGIAAFDSRRAFQDSLSSYEYLGSSPIAYQDPAGLFLSSFGAVGLGLELDAQRTDAAMSLLGAVRGLVGLANTQQTLLASLLGSISNQADTRDLDFALGVYEGWQRIRTVAMVGGALCAGAKFAQWGGERMAAAAVRWGFWDRLPKVIRNGRQYAQFGRYLLSDHAVHMMTPRTLGAAAGQKDVGRGIPPSVLQHVLDNGVSRSSRGRVTKELDGIRVVLEGDIIVTIITIGG